MPLPVLLLLVGIDVRLTGQFLRFDLPAEQPDQTLGVGEAGHSRDAVDAHLDLAIGADRDFDDLFRHLDSLAPQACPPAFPRDRRIISVLNISLLFVNGSDPGEPPAGPSARPCTTRR